MLNKMTEVGSSSDILILHDFFFSVGGAEWDAVKMARHFDAPIATFDSPESDQFDDIEFIEIGHAEDYPFGARELKIWLTNLYEGYRGTYDEYDAVIINKDWSKSAARAIDSPTIYYCHSPERHLYDSNEFRYEWLKDRSMPKAFLFKAFTGTMRPFDRGDIAAIDKITCNSKNIQGRCEKYYNISPDVIYPPVNTSQFEFQEVGDFWLNVSRLGPGKRIDFLIDLFNETGEPLKIVGSPDREEYYERYTAQANDNINFLRSVSWDRLKELYSTSRGLITVAKDEDFGLTPVESMASGKPVLAVDEGGYKETVVHDETGWLLPLEQEQFAQKITLLNDDAIRNMKEDCQQRAAEFDEGVFYESMEKTISDLTA